MSKLTVSPPRRLSKLSEVSTPLWWKKYSLPSSAAMNPNPRSDTIFFTVPFGIARSPPLEHRIERIGPVRERRMPAAREITRRPGERLYFSTPLGRGGRALWRRPRVSRPGYSLPFWGRAGRGRGWILAGDEVREGIMSWYSLLKFVHVLLAITAVGSNITYAAWNARGAMEPQHLSFALRGIKFIDNRVANPAYGLLLVTGLTLVAVGQWGFKGWIVAALILFAILIVVAVGFYSRVTNRQIQVLEAEGQSSPAYRQVEGQARLYGIISGVIALVIVFMMVVKPFS